MSAFNPQPSPGGFNFNMDHFLSGLSGMGAGSAMQNFGGGYSSQPTWSLQNPSVQNNAIKDISQLLPSNDRSWTYKGMGAFQQDPLKGPSVEQMWGGMLRDLQLQDQLNKENWMRNQAASDMFLNQSMKAAQEARNAGAEQWAKAYDFQQKGAQTAQDDFVRLQGQLQAAQTKLDEDKAEVGRIFDAAIGTIGQGADRVASDASIALQRRRESDVDLIRAQMGEFAGTESQIDEAARRRASEYDRELFGTIANLQYKSAADKAAAMQNKGQIFAQLATSTAGIAGQFAQIEFGAAESRNKWNEFGANIAMANAKFEGDMANNYAQLTSMNYKNYADMVFRNPVLGVTITPTLLSMAEAAKRYGEPGQYISPQSMRALGGFGLPSGYSYEYGGGLSGSSGEDPGDLLRRINPGSNFRRG